MSLEKSLNSEETNQKLRVVGRCTSSRRKRHRVLSEVSFRGLFRK